MNTTNSLSAALPENSPATSSAPFAVALARQLAQVAAATYQDGNLAIDAALAACGLPGTAVVINGQENTLAFVLPTEQAIYLAFRGTEPSSWANWRTDFAAERTPWALNPAWGEVHSGFQEALSGVLPVIEKWLAANNPQALPLRICGHSLGGALAALAAAALADQVTALYTYGQPRVGNAEFASQLNQRLGNRYLRFVNDQDIVPHVPPYELGYAHAGQEMYFNGSHWQAEALVPETLFEALSEDAELLGKLEGPIADHLLDSYLKALAAA